jgi:hypothetical protein
MWGQPPSAVRPQNQNIIPSGGGAVAEFPNHDVIVSGGIAGARDRTDSRSSDAAAKISALHGAHVPANGSGGPKPSYGPSDGCRRPQDDKLLSSCSCDRA